MNVSDVKNKLKKNKLVKLFRMVVLPKPYPKFYEKCAIQKNVVLYESFYGKGMTCGPKAIFDTLVSNSDYAHLTHIWVMDNRKNWQEEITQYKNQQNIKFVKIKSRKYYKYLASAGYLINNSTFPPCFTRKQGQEYINTWHGIPLKLMGYDMPNGNIEVANTERNFLQTTYLLSPNMHHTDMYMKSYKMEGIYQGKIIETGQARTDTIIKADKSFVIEKLKKAGLNIEDGKKIILYAPTWKGDSFSQAEVDITEYTKIFLNVSEAVRDNGYQVLIKPHQAVYHLLKKKGIMEEVLVSPKMDTNELLSVVDVLISDYSSIYFDFLSTKRPILFYIPDIQEYKEKRGIYMDVDMLPGPATDDLEQLCDWAKNPEKAMQEKIKNYRENIDKFCPYDDGKVTERIVKAIWGKDFHQIKVIDTQNEKKKIFISLGRALQNGITHSFLSLLENMDYDKYDVTAYLYEAVAPDQVVRMGQINSNVRVLVRTNYNFATKWELIRLIIGMAGNAKGIFRKILPDKYFERQAKRIAGNSSFDSVVEFCGYSPILAMVLPKLQGKTKAIWMHNDLIADANRKIGHKKPLKRKLTMIFNLYNDWDKLVSCSHSVMEVNKKNLSREGIENKFSYARNTINYNRVLKALDEGAEYEGFPMPEQKDTNFVTMGRLSTEKNHIALIRAFAEYRKQYPDSRLYILGEGPLRELVENGIEKLQLKDKVILTGNQANPFTLMRQCQCFILPSIYEGQPMVLLEARIVGLPIVVSDFSSVTDSLMENGQYLIKSDKDSILEGLTAFSKGNVPVKTFDPEQYNREAVEEFERAIL